MPTDRRRRQLGPGGTLDLAVVVIPDHTVDGAAGRTPVTVAELADETFIDFPAGGDDREDTDQTFRDAAATRTVAIEVTSLLERDGHRLMVEV